MCTQIYLCSNLYLCNTCVCIHLYQSMHRIIFRCLHVHMSYTHVSSCVIHTYTYCECAVSIFVHLYGIYSAKNNAWDVSSTQLMLVIFTINRFSRVDLCVRGAHRCVSLGRRCVNVYIQAGIVTLSVYIHAMFASVCLCPPVHMYGFPGTLFVETSWAAATWPHPPFPQGCSEGLGLAAASTAHAMVNMATNIQMPRAELTTWSPSSLSFSQSSVCPHPQSLICPLPSLSLSQQ